MLAFATAVSFATQVGADAANRVPSDFDLAKASSHAVSREEAAPREPVAPRNLDTRDFAVDMPEFEMSLADNGPIILVGAMGGRSGDVYKGLPKLAHVAVGWSF